MQLTQQWSMEMSAKSQDSVKASPCEHKADQILNILFLLHITRSQRRHYKCTILLKYLVRGPRHTVNCIRHQYCHALHILTANLCLNILHIKKNQKTKLFFKLYIFWLCIFFCIFFSNPFLKNKPETLGLLVVRRGALRAPPPTASSKSCYVIKQHSCRREAWKQECLEHFEEKGEIEWMEGATWN